MNKKKFYLLFVFSLLLNFIPLFAWSNMSKKYISVEKIDAKSKPSFFGKACDTFYYGDVVYVIEEKGSWIKIKDDDSGKTGWVKDSVVTTRKIVANRKVSVDAREIALAGKGFSSPLEAEYSEIYGIDFDNVDKVENVKISPEEVEEFIRKGDLRGEE